MRIRISFFPTPQTTQTIPSTAQRVISVGAYDSRYLAYADFSGRGYTRVTNEIKPDLVAPGWGLSQQRWEEDMKAAQEPPLPHLLSPVRLRLLMEWGIVQGK